MLRVGKYKGKRFSEAAADRGYCGWVLHTQPQGFAGFADFLKEAHGGLMTVGKHKGLFYDEIIVRDPGYADWARKLIEPSDALAEFIEYVEHVVEPMAKRHCAHQTQQDCVMCCDRTINTAFVPCGHAVACMECGTRFDGCPCPMCKRHVRSVLRTYAP